MNSRRDQLSAIAQPDASAPHRVTEPATTEAAVTEPAGSAAASNEGLEARVARRAPRLA
jgi:hypothetical protein